MLRKSLFALVTGCLLLAGCIGDGDMSLPDDDDSPARDLNFDFPNAFEALSFTSPVALLQAPNDDSRWFVVEQDGVIQVFDNDKDTSTTSEFLNIVPRVASANDGSGDETGLLGMAFHPDFPDDPRVFVYYTTNDGSGLISRVSYFNTEDDGDTLNPDSEVVLLSVRQPENNHNGGNLAFDANKLLFIGLGDGGGGGDDHGDIGNGQDTETLLGKILRIDVGLPDDEEYTIPDDNPYVGNDLCDTGSGNDDCPEIYASGFRNPWRWSFDRDNNDLWVADVGESSWEEVDQVSLGGNYGWRCREGAHNFKNTECGNPDSGSLEDPVVEYSHDVGNSVIGGFVYRGSEIPDLVGRYVFGDLSGMFFSIATDTPVTTELAASDGVDSGLTILSFAQALDGELYLLAGDGTIRHIEAT